MDEQHPESRRETVSRYIFFADICRSTLLYDQLGDRQAAELMKYCLDTGTGLIEAGAGRLVDTRGDELLALFDTASDAMKTACAFHAFSAEDERCQAHHVAFRIGVHRGRIIEMEQALYGDAVNIAARLAEKSKARQTLLSADVVAQSDPAFEPLLRALGDFTLRGKPGMLELFELLTPSTSEDVTEVARRREPPRRMSRLALTYQHRPIRLDAGTARFLLGRNPDNDLVIEHPSISRYHAEIRYRHGRFQLFDVSTNGTRIRRPDGAVVVHRSDLELPREGIIQLGRTESFPNLHIRFRAH